MRILWHRLLTAPAVHIESVKGETTLVRVDGVVCDRVCAVNTKKALEGVEGVRRVTVDFDRGLATVEGVPQSQAKYQRALDGVVSGGGVRRFIESTVRRLRRS